MARCESADVFDVVHDVCTMSRVGDCCGVYVYGYGSMRRPLGLES